jgi:KDO2-lipid IV(A) lauroyltransferase
MTGEAPPLAWVRGDPAQRLAWRRYWVRDTVWGLADTAIHHALRLATVDGCSRTGAVLGSLLGPRNPARARRAREALARLRPDLDGPGLEAALRRFWAALGRSMTEFSVLPRLWRASSAPVVGLEHLEAARATDRPRIFLGLHLGNWELAGPRLIDLGEDLLQFFQPPRSRFKRRITERIRRHYRERLLPPSIVGVRRAMRQLTQGQGALVIFGDEFQHGRVGAPSFGRPLRLDGNLAKAARFAAAADAAVLPVYVVREAGTRFTLHIEPAVALARTGDADADLRENVRRLDARLEPIVRRHADQWFMLHELRFEP